MPVTHDGVRRSPLDRDRLSAIGPELVPGLQVEVLEETPSTNAEVAERARAGAPEWTVVVTEHQTRGRGRLDRTWETPAGSALTFSVLLRPIVPAPQWPWLPLLTGYAVTKALVADGYAAGVKWPNDVLIRSGTEERKVCGILVERVETPDGPAAVVGIGLNTGMTPEELPVPTATSLAIEKGEQPDRTGLLLLLLGTLAEAYDAWQLGGDAAAARLQTSYSESCVTVGRQVRAELPGGAVLEGEAVRVDESGRLVVRTSDGETAVGAGDVVHVRAR